jgi:hypothetical protein
MDTAQSVGTIGGYIAILVFVFGAIWAALNHHRIKSSCCGVQASLEVDSIDKKAVGFQAAAAVPSSESQEVSSK